MDCFAPLRKRFALSQAKAGNILFKTVKPNYNAADDLIEESP